MARTAGHTEPIGHGSLEINEDTDFQRRSWAVQRAGWMLMAALVVAALLGLFSGGVLSHAVAEAPSGSVAVEYDRFIRYDAPASLHIRFSSPALRDGYVSIRIGGDLVEKAEIERIMPEPENALTTAEGIEMRFPVAGGLSAGVVQIGIRPIRPGVLSGSVAVADGEAVRFSQFVYP